MNRISLKNMTEEEKKAHKREIHRLHQRKYYEKNKDYYRNYQRNWARKLIKDRDKEIERLNNVINEANKCILEFIQTEEYNKVDGLAIADNYMRLMQILGTPTTYKELKENNK